MTNINKSIALRYAFPIIFFLAVLLPLTSYAKEATTTPADDLLALLGTIKTMRADFTQTTFAKNAKAMGMGQGQQKITGEMALSRPGKFRWQTKKPMQQLIIANGSLVWIYDADLAQVTKQSINNNQSGNPAELLSGDNDKLRNTFTITRIKTNVLGHDCFELRPTAKNSMYHFIHLMFIDGKLSNMMMEDNLGQKSKFDFTNVKFNPDLPSSLFVFVAPKGVDVIDNTVPQS